MHVQIVVQVLYEYMTRLRYHECVGSWIFNYSFMKWNIEGDWTYHVQFPLRVEID